LPRVFIEYPNLAALLIKNSRYHVVFREILDSQCGGEYEDDSLLGQSAV
jgi:hypothetical protein